ncbi:glycosyltransferase family 2 protein [Clostridium cibarium]|uniref:Glycosyltransferase n=1 Tax=Clostridium cibarium TaxID=2762247 RepID=A0ABR8PNU8_9CLOT|nr:glycosyltransferase family 2 protein [Clostridium cibarium]MBD7909852.1 glycosyltransferase [Clostridium cibarium]
MISVCMIVKNEAVILEETLKSINKYGYEIVIVDTGSTDNTKEIAYKYTDKVFNYKWDNNFSNARNFSISNASNEFVLIVDSDEVVINLDTALLDSLIKNNREKIGRLLIKNEFTQKGVKCESRERISRLFSKKYYMFRGSIHEQIVPIENVKVEKYDIPVEVNHFGYRKDEILRKGKIKRNISMLTSELEEKGEDPYILYQLGKSFYTEESYIDASQYFEKALYFDLNLELEYVQDMVESYGYSLINSEQYEESMKLLNIYNEFSNSADFVFLVGLIYMNNGMFREAIDEFEKAMRKTKAKMIGSNSFLANYNIGVILECLGDVKEASKHYRMCDQYEPAQKRLSILDKK